jgi:hypothetical protein
VADDFPWPSYYRHFKFFEARMRQHGCIARIKSAENGVYDLALSSGDSLRVFVCDCYSFGAAEYAETIDKLGKLDAIVINSAWCSYTSDAKRTCRSNQVGLFKIGDFMAALNKPRIWEYLTEAETAAFTKKGWL